MVMFLQVGVLQTSIDMLQKALDAARQDLAESRKQQEEDTEYIHRLKAQVRNIINHPGPYIGKPVTVTSFPVHGLCIMYVH